MISFVGEFVAVAMNFFWKSKLNIITSELKLCVNFF